MLVYALHRAGLRTGDPALVAAAERAWPRDRRPGAGERVRHARRRVRATATLPLSDARRAQLAGYLGQYGIPINGRRCLHAAALLLATSSSSTRSRVLSITGAGVALARPGRAARRPGGRARGRRRDRQPRASRRSSTTASARGSTAARCAAPCCRDPPADPLAYHALSDVHARRGGRASSAPARRAAALRARRETLDALSVLVAPDGDTSYLGRGQAPDLGARRSPPRRWPPARATSPRPTRKRAAPLPRRARSAPCSGSPRCTPARRASSSCPARAARDDRRRDRRLRPHGRLQRPRAVRPHRARSTRSPRSRRAPIGALAADGRLTRAGRARERPRRRRRTAASGSPSTRRPTERRTTCATTSARSRSSAARRPAGSTCSPRGR